MAWVDEGQGGYWIEREERAELIAERKALLDEIDRVAPTVDDKEAAGLLLEYYEVYKEYERLERIHRCEVDTYEFALEYFSEHRNPGNDGNWDGFDIKTKEEAPNFHVEMTDILDEVSTRKRNAHIAVAAPRSHAKSTYYTKDFPIHQTVYRKRKYIIVISETPSVATANMSWIRDQLKRNKKLREDFGPLLSDDKSGNETTARNLLRGIRSLTVKS